MALTIEVEQEDDGRWLAEVPDVPGVLVYGQTREEAIERVQALSQRVLADARSAEAMMQELVAMYENGAITADHLVVECLHRLDPADPAKVLAPLPEAVLLRMLRYTHLYRPGAMRTNYGIQPDEDQVAAAKGWIEAHCEPEWNTDEH